MLPSRMKAAVLHGREDVRIEWVEVPRPGPGEVLLRTEVALTCGTDGKVYRRGYHARMLTPPALFGHEVAGVVEAVGPGVSGWEVGTAVVAANSAPCGVCAPCRRGRASLCDDLLFWNGAYAEFACLPARIVARNLLPLGDVSFRGGAMVEPLACVVRGLEGMPVGPGQSLVVIGTGPIALMFVILASRRGSRVIMIGRRDEALARGAALGASVTLKAAENDIVQRVRDATAGGADVVVEAAGQPETAQLALEMVGKGGTVNLFAGCAAGTQLSLDAQRVHYEEITVTSTFHHTPDAFRAALKHIAEGDVDPEALIDGEAPLERLPEILRAMGHGSGLKTAIRPGL